MWLLLLACGSAPEPVAPAPAAPKEVPAEELAALREHMHGHLGKATVAYEALIDGEMEQAREALTWLAEHDAPELPPGADPYVTRMQLVAKGAAAAPMYPEVAGGIAELGAVCGACHTAQQASPSTVLGEPPPASTDFYAHMARHKWAVRALWTGMVVPSDDAWAKGVQALSDAHLDDAAFDVPELSAEAKAQARTAHEVAQRSANAATPKDRANAFRAVATACAGCHAEMRGE